MNSLHFIRLGALVTGSVLALAVRAQTPAASPWPTAPLGSFDPADPVSIQTVMAARAPELVLVPKLRGVVFVSDAAGAAAPIPAGFAGVDASQVSLLRDRPGVPEAVKIFLDRPASLPSLGRLALVMRTWLQEAGERFVVAYVPPQDLTEGVVRVVVARATLDAEPTVRGAKYFSAEQYRRALPLTAGQPLDAAELHAATEALNQNPFRRVMTAIEPGQSPGTSRVAIQVEEQRPWRFNAGYSSSGTPTTGEDRLSAGVTWGNAFGRGDLLSYNFGSDRAVEHLVSHSGSYATILPWRHTLSLSGAWSKLEAKMPAPLAQQGNTWQVGANYALPLGAPREGWTQSLSFSADFKYSDNTLEFATIPITDNVTHVAQLGATYGVSFRALGGQNAVSVTGFASPGGLTRYNKSDAFAGSRPGAKAGYVYGQLSASHRRALPRGFSWMSSAEAQLAGGALLGSEQLNGGGSGAVRGYGESTAFGDGGVVMNHELHAPGFSLLAKNDHLDLFAFVDVASLNLNVERESTDLRSAGVGLNYQWSRHFSVRASYGWQMKQLDGSTERSRGHVAANVSW